MAGEDSPTEKKEEFNFGRSTPPPTTSYVAASKPDYSDIKTVAEPAKEEKEKDKDKEKEKDEKNEIDVMRPDANPGYSSDGVKKKSEDEDGKKRDKREDKDGDWDKGGEPGKKVDGSDRLDGQWIPSTDVKNQTVEDEENDDDCAVKCLYYTMQCCECSIS